MDPENSSNLYLEFPCTERIRIQSAISRGPVHSNLLVSRLAHCILQSGLLYVYIYIYINPGAHAHFNPQINLFIASTINTQIMYSGLYSSIYSIFGYCDFFNNDYYSQNSYNSIYIHIKYTYSLLTFLYIFKKIDPRYLL